MLSGGLGEINLEVGSRRCRGCRGHSKRSRSQLLKPLKERAVNQSELATRALQGRHTADGNLPWMLTRAEGCCYRARQKPTLTRGAFAVVLCHCYHRRGLRRVAFGMIHTLESGRYAVTTHNTSWWPYSTTTWTA